MPLLKLKTAAIEEPVSLDEFMTHARIDDSGDQSDIAGKLLAARVHTEDAMCRALCTSTWQAFFRAWPGRRDDFVFRLPLGDLQEVASIIYTDATGTHTVDPATYEVDELAGEVLLADGCSWPSGVLKKANPICIEFICGKAAADVKPTHKQAIELLAAHWYRNREAVTVGRTTVESMPLKMAFDTLTTPDTLWKF